jgi:hypothetical protein
VLCKNLKIVVLPVIVLELEWQILSTSF